MPGGDIDGHTNSETALERVAHGELHLPLAIEVCAGSAGRAERRIAGYVVRIVEHRRNSRIGVADEELCITYIVWLRLLTCSVLKRLKASTSTSIF